MRKRAIGIIANPQSGRDIRRLVAHASVFDNEEKVNIVERLLATWNTMGLKSVYFMPDSYNIVLRAADRVKHVTFEIDPLEMTPSYTDKDTASAAQKLQELVDVIVIIGGDGTNRVAVKGLDLSDPVPIASISTGTNNVFPAMVEATVAGLAAWTLTLESVNIEQITRKEKVLNIYWDEGKDLALVDVAFTSERFIGSKAVWNPEAIKAVFCSRARPESVGFSSLPGFLCPSKESDPFGSYVTLSEDGRNILFPMAPGKIEQVHIDSYGRMDPEKPYTFSLAEGTVALDGEREIEVFKDTSFTVQLSLNGPITVDVARALNYAVSEGLFYR